MQAIQRVEKKIGRKFKIDHQYRQWTDAIPTAYDTWTRDEGRIPFINWKLPKPWSAVTNKSQDAWIAKRAEALKAFGSPVYLSLHHEPEDNTGSGSGLYGTMEQYRSAWQRVVTIFRQHDVTNVTFVWAMTAWTLDPRSGRNPLDWYPGDAYVDVIGADGYRWTPQKGHAWDTFRQVFAGANAFAIGHGKPWMVVEYGALEKPAGDSTHESKATWLAGARATAKTWPSLKAVLLFDENKVEPGGPFNWVSHSSDGALAAYRAMANDPYFDPPVGPTVFAADAATGIHRLGGAIEGVSWWKRGADSKDVGKVTRFETITELYKRQSGADGWTFQSKVTCDGTTAFKNLSTRDPFKCATATVGVSSGRWRSRTAACVYWGSVKSCSYDPDGPGWLYSPVLKI
jgi:hypothetical protein